MNSLPNDGLHDHASNFSRIKFTFLTGARALFCAGVMPAQESQKTAVAAASLSSHKIKTDDPALAKQVAAQGGKLLADYGSYQVYELSQARLDLLVNQHVEVRDEYNVIQLNAAPLDTTKPEVKALRKTVGNFKGKRM